MGARMNNMDRRVDKYNSGIGYALNAHVIKTVLIHWVCSLRDWERPYSQYKQNEGSSDEGLAANGVMLHCLAMLYWTGDVHEFPYPGGLIIDDGGVDREISSRLAFRTLFPMAFPVQSPKVSGSSVLCANNLIIWVTDVVCEAVSSRHLNMFHRSCLRCTLGVSRTAHWYKRLPSEVLSRRPALLPDVPTMLSKDRLWWLGRAPRMPPSRVPKQHAFGERTNTRCRHGPHKRWRDIVVTGTALLEAAGWH